MSPGSSGSRSRGPASSTAWAPSSAPITTSRSGQREERLARNVDDARRPRRAHDHLRFGVLVSPATFRHPSVLAKVVAAVDQISGGRVDFGLGAGWNEREHEAYGFDSHRSAPAWSCSRNSSRSSAAPGPRGRSPSPESTTPWSIWTPSQTGAAPAPAGHHRRRRQAADRAHGRPVRRRVQHRPRHPGRVRRAACRVSSSAWQDAGRDPASLTFSVMVPWLTGVDAADLGRVERLAAWRGSDASRRRVRRGRRHRHARRGGRAPARLSRCRHRPDHAPAPAARRSRRDRADSPPRRGA